MSSSGQAPNFSMDELLASIKSMIEGESNGGATSQQNLAAAEEPPRGGETPALTAPEEDAVMDLTQVVQQPAPQQVHQQASPQHHAGQPGDQPDQHGLAGMPAGMPEGGMPHGDGRMQPPPNAGPAVAGGHMQGGEMPPTGQMPLRGQMPPGGHPQEALAQQRGHGDGQHQPQGAPPHLGGPQEKPTPPQGLSQQTLVSSRQPERGSAQETAAQINDLLGEMDDDFGIAQPERAGDASQPSPSAADFGFGQGGEQPDREAFEAPRHEAGAAEAREVENRDQDGFAGFDAEFDRNSDDPFGIGRDAFGDRSMAADDEAAARGIQPLASQQNVAPQGRVPEMAPGYGLRNDGGEPDAGTPAAELGRGMQPHPQGHVQAGSPHGAMAPHGNGGQGQGTPGNLGNPGHPAQLPPAGMDGMGRANAPLQPREHLPNQGIQAGHEQRMESEIAMGQALSQADASLGINQGQQPPFGQGLHAGQHPGQHPGGAEGGMMRGIGQPMQQAPAADYQGQLPAVSNGDRLPVAHGHWQNVAPAPMIMGMATPTADHMPVEMRNNLEEIVKQLLKPMLRDWLDRNLPELLQGAMNDKGQIDPDKL